MLKRLVFVCVVMTATISTPAIAQEGDVPVATYEPLATIIGAFTSGQDVDGLVLTNESESAAISSQFQILVNTARDPIFAEEETTLIFSGIAEGDTPALVSIEEFFPEGEVFRSVPPLAPFVDRENGFDTQTVAEGWLAFGEEGPIEDSTVFFEQFQTVFGMELAEPFDPTCPSTSFVGRAWEGASVTSGPDPMFTQEALEDTHAALVGEASRYVELECFPGSTPIIRSKRMKEGAGSRYFGPTGTIALVKGQFVVFFSPVRIYDGDLRQFYYATPPGGGSVEVSEPESDVQVLLPNPYESLNTRITIVPSDAEESAFSADDSARSLLHTPGPPTAITAQSSTGNDCPVAGELFIDDLLMGAATTGFLRARSTFASFNRRGETAEIEFVLPSGSRVSMDFDLEDGTVETRRYAADTSDSSPPACTRTDTFLVDGAPPAQAAADDPVEEPSTDSTGPTQEPATDGSAASGEDADDGGTIPWIPIGIALALLAGVGVLIGRGRTRTRTKDCTPEEQAYAAALAAYDPALKALQDAEDARHAAALRAVELEGAAGFRLPKPVLGYDPQPGRAEAVLEEQLAEWNAQEAAAEDANANLEGARAALADAESHRAEAEAAFLTAKDTLETARIALSACKGSAPAARDDEVVVVPPPTVPVPPTPPPSRTPPEDPDEEHCSDGDTDEREVGQKQFRIIEGDVLITAPTGKWNTAFPGGKVDAEDLVNIDSDDLLDFFSDLDNRASAVTIRITIPTVILSVACIQDLECQNNEMVDVGDVRRTETRTPGEPIILVHKSKDKLLTARKVQEAQARIAEFRKDQEDPTDFECD